MIGTVTVNEESLTSTVLVNRDLLTRYSGKEKLGFNLGRLPKHKFKVCFTAISKTKRTRMMKLCMQAHMTPTKRFKQQQKRVET